MTHAILPMQYTYKNTAHMQPPAWQTVLRTLRLLHFLKVQICEGPNILHPNFRSIHKRDGHKHTAGEAPWHPCGQGICRTLGFGIKILGKTKDVRPKGFITLSSRPERPSFQG